jgi:hypothetical protein
MSTNMLNFFLYLKLLLNYKHFPVWVGYHLVPVGYKRNNSYQTYFRYAPSMFIIAHLIMNIRICLTHDSVQVQCDLQRVLF